MSSSAPSSGAAPHPPELQLIERLILHDLAMHGGAVLWPRASAEIPDDAMGFRVAYMGLDWADLSDEELRHRLDGLHRFCGHTRRQFRNALAFALPERRGIDEALALARGLLERTGGEVLRAAEAARFEGKSMRSLHGRLSRIYGHVYIPSEGQAYLGETQFDAVALDMDHTEENLHTGVLRRLEPYFRHTLSPEELAWTIGLGRTDSSGVMRVLFPLADVARWFFIFLNLPRLLSVDPIRAAIAKGVGRGVFGLISRRDLLELDHVPPDVRGGLLFRTQINAEDVSFEPGAYLVWSGALEREPPEGGPQ